MVKPVSVTPLSGFRLRIRYEDGVEGEVDVSHLVDKGVFSIWREPGGFDGVSIGPGGAIQWGEEVDLCPDALYMEISGKSPEQIFPNLARTAVDA